MGNTIISHTKINNDCIWHNKILIHKTDKAGSYMDFLDESYKNLNVSYSKFFKMDALSKLGVLCAELILRDENIKPFYTKEKTAIVLSNKSSSLNTDRAYSRTMGSFPSPALFVYTLPNIVIGEIAIKHKITGENAFFIEPMFNAQLLHNYTELLLRDADTVICGWLNIDEDNCEGFIYFVTKEKAVIEKTSNFINHNPDNINQLYFK